jgi:hypothetical protein
MVIMVVLSISQKIKDSLLVYDLGFQLDKKIQITDRKIIISLSIFTQKVLVL